MIANNKNSPLITEKETIILVKLNIEPNNGPINNPNPLAASKYPITLSVSSGHSDMSIAGAEVIEHPAPIPANILDTILKIRVEIRPENSMRPMMNKDIANNKNPNTSTFFLPITFIYFPTNIDVGRPIIGSILKIRPMVQTGNPFE